METTGFLWPALFKVNRKLKSEEIKYHLAQDKPCDDRIHASRRLIRFNSTFVESVDLFHLWKGFPSMLGLAAVSVAAFGATGIIYYLFFDTRDIPEYNRPGFFLTLMVIIADAFMWALAIHMLRGECFGLTHWPIRFNRKLRRVYAMRRDGSANTVDWDQAFFTIARVSRNYGYQNWCIHCHVLAEDRKTVLETFALGLDSPNHSELRGHWEFFRRYMEDGPESVYDEERFYLPIATRKEPFLCGLQSIFLTYGTPNIAWLLMLPLTVVLSLTRAFAIHTSRTPVWSAGVEAECAIEPNDPFERDARHNPPGMWGVPSTRRPVNDIWKDMGR